jgi:uncharacterized YigZ family protein
LTADPDRYVIPAARGEASRVEKRSRFIAVAAPVFTPVAAQALVETRRRLFHDAAHHAYAFRVDDLERCSDDGEPSGTAGKPILAAITAAGVESVAVVVTRYFGGVKLGPGGLARAYGDVAKDALEQAGREERFRMQQVVVQFDFELTSPVHHILQKFDATTAESHYSERVQMTVELRRSQVQPFKAALLAATAGRVEFSHDV